MIHFIFIVNFNPDTTHLIFSQKEILEKNATLQKHFLFSKMTYLSKLPKKSSSSVLMERRKIILNSDRRATWFFV